MKDLVIDYPYLNLDTLKHNLSRKKTKLKGPYIVGDLEIYKGPVKEKK